MSTGAGRWPPSRITSYNVCYTKLLRTRLGGRFTLRLCVGQTHTEAPHVEAAWAAIREAATDL